MKRTQYLKLFVDDDGYVCFYQRGTDRGQARVDIWWTLHDDGWEAYIDDGSFKSVYSTNEHTFPEDSDLETVFELLTEPGDDDAQEA